MLKTAQIESPHQRTTLFCKDMSGMYRPIINTTSDWL